MLRQIENIDWDEVAHSVLLCVIPYSVKQLEESFKLKFDQYVEAGLGDCFAAYVNICKTKYFLMGCVSRESMELGISVYIRSFERTPSISLEQICRFFKIDKEKLEDIMPSLSGPKWSVYCLDDKYNEIEIQRFLEHSSAISYSKDFERKHNEQRYYVKEIE